MKRLFCIYMISLFFLCQALAADIPGPSRAFYLNDYASVISNRIFWQYANALKKMDEAEKGQIVVTTIPSLEGEALDTYASRMFNAYQIGGQQQKGALVLLVREEKLVSIKVGSGLADVLTPEVCSSIIQEHVEKNIKRNDFQSAVFEMIYAFRQKIHPEGIAVKPKRGFFETIHIESIFVLLFLMIAFLVSTVTFLRRKDKKEEKICMSLSMLSRGDLGFRELAKLREKKCVDTKEKDKS